jgi:hypothetical protein
MLPENNLDAKHDDEKMRGSLQEAARLVGDISCGRHIMQARVGSSSP